MEYRWADAHYLIICMGMSDASMGSFIADDTWMMRHGTPGSGLVPFHVDKTRPATLDEALFLADCLSYDHDMPTVVRPSATTSGANTVLIDPVMPYLGDQPGLWYFDVLEDALTMSTDLRVGGPVLLRYEPRDDPMTRFAGRLPMLWNPSLSTRWPHGSSMFLPSTCASTAFLSGLNRTTGNPSSLATSMMSGPITSATYRQFGIYPCRRTPTTACSAYISNVPPQGSITAPEQASLQQTSPRGCTTSATLSLMASAPPW